MNQGSGRRFIGPAILLVAALIAVAPLLVRGSSCGHDFDFHLVSWLAALHSWRQGIVYPHWAASANYGAGSPRFVFYPPLTWMLGAALGAELPWNLAPIALTFLLLAATGLGTRRLAREVLGEGPATLAGGAAIFSTYALFTAYERTAFAELAGGLWVPLVLLFALRRRAPSGPLLRRAFDGSAAPLAIAIAGTWLSNDPLGVMVCYMLAGVALAAAVAQRSWAPIVRAAASTALGLGVAAFYLVPAAWEQSWVAIGQVIADPAEQFQTSWLFARHADPSLQAHDGVLHTVSIAGAIMFAAAFTGLGVGWRRGRFLAKGDRWAAFWIPVALIPFAVLFLQLPESAPLWNLVPRLHFLQFPWRWLVCLEAPMGLLIAAAVWPARPRWRLAVGGACAAAFLSAGYFGAGAYFQVCEDSETPLAMASIDRAGLGFEGASEYVPRGVDSTNIPMGLPQSCLVSEPLAPLAAEPADPDSVPEFEQSQHTCEATFKGYGSNAEHVRFAFESAQAGYLVLRLLNYPAWRVRVNGSLVASLPRRDDGLIAVPVGAGRVAVAADWTATGDVIAGRWLSVLSVLLLTGLGAGERRLSGTRLS